MLTVTHHKGNLLDLPPLPSAALAHPRSMDFRENPASATQVFPDASADHKQSDDCLRNSATLQDVHGWAQRHSSGTPDSKIDLAFWQRLMVLSWRTCRAQLPRILSSCGKFSSSDFSGALCWCLSHLRWFLMSQLSVDFVLALASACPTLHSVLSRWKCTFYTKPENCWTQSMRQILTIH